MKKKVYLNMLVKIYNLMVWTGTPEAYFLSSEDCGRAFAIKKEILTIIKNNGYEINPKTDRLVKSKPKPKL